MPMLVGSPLIAPAVVTGSPQLQLKTPNALGSAFAGVATPTATMSAAVALNSTFVITYGSPC
jgi:hypothetical protein